jgi:hypothetical protein
MSQTRSGRTPLFALLGAVTVIAGILAFIFFAQSTLNIAQAGRPLADDEMNAVRQRFGQAQPCLERPDGAGPATPTAPGAPIAAVHMLAWSPGDRLVRATTPYWALRAGAWKIRFVRSAVPVLEYVTLADVEKCGRGVLIDRTTSRGGRVVIWVD